MSDELLKLTSSSKAPTKALEKLPDDELIKLANEILKLDQFQVDSKGYKIIPVNLSYHMIKRTHQIAYQQVIKQMNIEQKNSYLGFQGLGSIICQLIFAIVEKVVPFQRDKIVLPRNIFDLNNKIENRRFESLNQLIAFYRRAPAAFFTLELKKDLMSKSDIFTLSAFLETMTLPYVRTCFE